MKLKQKIFTRIFARDEHLFVFSNYPKDSRFYDEINKNVISKMKYESKGKKKIEFVGLKSKMCSLIDVVGKVNKKRK